MAVGFCDSGAEDHFALPKDVVDEQDSIFVQEFVVYDISIVIYVPKEVGQNTE